MKVLGLFGKTPKAKYKSYKGDMNGTCKNQLLDKKVDEANHKTTYERNFSTTGFNQKLAKDVSEFHIAAGKLYLSPIIDMHNNEMFYGHEYEFKSLEQLKKEMEDYITYYNEKRITVKLKGLTPLQIRAQAL